MRITFARHGESQANVERIFSNEGWSHGLTPRGTQQAEELAERLIGEGVTRIYSSPLKRTVQTAEVIGSYLDLPYEDAPALVEFSVGTYEGKCDQSAWSEYQRVERAWLLDGRHEERIGGGECHTDILNRMIPFVDSLKTQFANTEEHILCISHGGTLVCSLPWILSNVSVQFAIENPLFQASTVKCVLRNASLECMSWGLNGLIPG